MYRLEYIDTGDIRDLRRLGQQRGPAIFKAIRCYGGSASSQSNPATYTTSGSASPIVSGSSGAVAGSGSIALGSGANYQETGSLNLSGADLSTVGGNVTASTGSTVNITPSAADAAIQSAIGYLANGGTIPVTTSGGGGGTIVVAPPTSTSSASWLSDINWTLLAIAGIGALVIYMIFGSKRK